MNRSLRLLVLGDLLTMTGSVAWLVGTAARTAPRHGPAPTAHQDGG